MNYQRLVTLVAIGVALLALAGGNALDARAAGGKRPGGMPSTGEIALLGSNGNRIHGKIVGNQLMIVSPENMEAAKSLPHFVPAPRGIFTLENGISLVVGENGKIIERRRLTGGSAQQQPRPAPPVVPNPPAIIDMN